MICQMHVSIYILVLPNEQTKVLPRQFFFFFLKKRDACKHFVSIFLVYVYMHVLASSACIGHKKIYVGI